MSRFLPFLLLFATGCEELDAFLPTIAFQTLDVNEIDFTEAKVDFVFGVDNPNPVDVGLSSFSYKLGLEGVELLQGDNADGFQLAASDASELRLPVDLNWQQTWETVQATRGEDNVAFGLKGRFGFDTPLGEARIPYDEGGQFPALRTPKFRFKNLRATGVNILQGTANLELDLGVDNDQGSSLFFDSFDYGVTLDGQPLATGLINTFEVASASEGDLSLPIQLNLFTVGATIVNAVTSGGALDVGLGANMDVQTPFRDLQGNPVIVPLSVSEAAPVNITL